MTRKSSGIPVVPASRDVREHVIEFTAYTADDGETSGLATVTAINGRIPFTQLAAIPGFIKGDVIDHADGESGPAMLGPGTDAPGHPAWCTYHDDNNGDGTSNCLGDRSDVKDPGGEDKAALSASLVRSTGQAPRVFLHVQDADDSLPLGQAREYALLLLSLVEQAHAGSAVA